MRAGAKLDAKAKARLTEINQQLAGLFTKFSNNVLYEENNQFVQLKSEADLAGLPQSIKDAAAAAAAEKKQEGWLIVNTRSSVDPFSSIPIGGPARKGLAHVHHARRQRGRRDNNAAITQVLQLRAERAKLLGDTTHAHWRVENSMAKNACRTWELMMR